MRDLHAVFAEHADRRIVVGFDAEGTARVVMQRLDQHGLWREDYELARGHRAKEFARTLAGNAGP